ncbi:MAG: hypothetical protein QGD94_01740, partial [Planctomycetia bacterium]|nr:hypothetical protein [Planctomycetia bacterium]
MSPAPQRFYIHLGWGLLALALAATVLHAVLHLAPPAWRQSPGLFEGAGISLALALMSLVGSFIVQRRTGGRVAISAPIFSNAWLL